MNRVGSRLLAAAMAVAMGGATAADRSAQAVDEAAAAILEADRAFNDAVARRDLQAFLGSVAEDATFAGGGTPLHGREAIGRAWAPYFQPDGPRLTWTPVEAHVLAGGGVGVTTGTFVLRATDASGTPSETSGEYLTVWRKQADGVWRAVFDTGS
jgi:uncharacterized protein (TIGR02246 family)